jgi:hypothetical protein
MAEAASWLGSLSTLWNGSKNDASLEAESDDTSSASNSTESSYGFVLDENYMIRARARDEMEDDVSDLFDSVDDNRSAYSFHSNKSTIMPKRKIKRTNSLPAIRFNTIKEGMHENEDYEALLRSKMSGLWFRIQEDAKREHISERPETEDDIALLDAFGSKQTLIRNIERISPWAS